MFLSKLILSFYKQNVLEKCINYLRAQARPQYVAPTVTLPRYKPQTPATVSTQHYSQPNVHGNPNHSNTEYTEETYEKRPYSFKYVVPEGKFEHEEASDTKEVKGRYDIETAGFDSETIYSVKQGSGLIAQSSYSINPSH